MPSYLRNVKRTGFLRDEHYRVEDRGFETPCWIWRGERNSYVTVRYGGGQSTGHRIAWEMAHGPIPSGSHVHHRCEVKTCVNPEHLELLTRAEHMARHAEQRTHCRRGHPFNDANSVVTSRGARSCLACRRERHRERNPYVRSRALKDDNVIGRNIRTRRQDLGLTQRELGLDLEMPEMTVSRWERGEHLPSLGHLQRVAKRLDCSIDDLLEDKKETAA